MKALLLASLLFLTPAMAMADNDAPGLTCDVAKQDLQTVVTRYNHLVDEFKATDDRHEKAIIYLEGEPLKELAQYLVGWLKENCKDI